MNKVLVTGFLLTLVFDQNVELLGINIPRRLTTQHVTNELATSSIGGNLQQGRQNLKHRKKYTKRLAALGNLPSTGLTGVHNHAKEIAVQRTGYGGGSEIFPVDHEHTNILHKTSSAYQMLGSDVPYAATRLGSQRRFGGEQKSGLLTRAGAMRSSSGYESINRMTSEAIPMKAQVQDTAVNQNSIRGQLIHSSKSGGSRRANLRKSSQRRSRKRKNSRKGRRGTRRKKNSRKSRRKGTKRKKNSRKSRRKGTKRRDRLLDKTAAIGNAKNIAGKWLDFIGAKHSSRNSHKVKKVYDARQNENNWRLDHIANNEPEPWSSNQRFESSQSHRSHQQYSGSGSDGRARSNAGNANGGFIVVDNTPKSWSGNQRFETGQSQRSHQQYNNNEGDGHVKFNSGISRDLMTESSRDQGFGGKTLNQVSFQQSTRRTGEGIENGAQKAMLRAQNNDEGWSETAKDFTQTQHSNSGRSGAAVINNRRQGSTNMVGIMDHGNGRENLIHSSDGIQRFHTDQRQRSDYQESSGNGDGKHFTRSRGYKGSKSKGRGLSETYQSHKEGQGGDNFAQIGQHVGIAKTGSGDSEGFESNENQIGYHKQRSSTRFSDDSGVGGSSGFDSSAPEMQAGKSMIDIDSNRRETYPINKGGFSSVHSYSESQFAKGNRNKLDAVGDRRKVGGSMVRTELGNGNGNAAESSFGSSHMFKNSRSGSSHNAHSVVSGKADGNFRTISGKKGRGLVFENTREGIERKDNRATSQSVGTQRINVDELFSSKEGGSIAENGEHALLLNSKGGRLNSFNSLKSSNSGRNEAKTMVQTGRAIGQKNVKQTLGLGAGISGASKKQWSSTSTGVGISKSAMQKGVGTNNMRTIADAEGVSGLSGGQTAMIKGFNQQSSSSRSSSRNGNRRADSGQSAVSENVAIDKVRSIENTGVGARQAKATEGRRKFSGSAGSAMLTGSAAGVAGFTSKRKSHAMNQVSSIGRSMATGKGKSATAAEIGAIDSMRGLNELGGAEELTKGAASKNSHSFHQSSSSSSSFSNSSGDK